MQAFATRYLEGQPKPPAIPDGFWHDGHMPLDVARLRADTRGTETVTHLNSAGSSLMPRQVADTVVAHVRREEEIGGYEAAAEASGRLERVYGALANLVGAMPEQMMLAESGTAAWATAVSVLPLAGRRVLLGRTEYGSNIRALRRLAQQRALELVVLEDDDGGGLNLEDLRQELHAGDVGLVALTHVPMAGGLVHDAAAVGALCREAGVPFVLDACQSVGQLPIDVADLQCDILVGTGRKFLRGPRGTAFAYVSTAVLDALAAGLDERRSSFPQLPRDRPYARLLESVEAGMAARLGLGRAAEYALDLGIDSINNRIEELAESLRVRLADIPSIKLHGHEAIGIVTFSAHGTTAEKLKQHLSADHINVSTVPLPPSDPTAVLQQPPATVPTAVRASVHCFNTHEEIERLVSALRRLTAVPGR